MMDVSFYFYGDVDNMTLKEVQEKRAYNLKKYGLSQQEIDKVVIPVLKEKETSEVFDKKTNQQFEREKLLSRLTVLRSALQFIQHGSPNVFLFFGFECEG